MNITLFTTGGTIDKTYFDQKDTYHVGEPQSPGVLSRANVTLDYKVVSLMQKDSLEITDDDRQIMLDAISKSESKHVVVTHGTDTLVKTAKFLAAISNKVIVLTGSMLPAQYRDSDAVFNLGGAFVAVQTLPEGVYIVINGQVFEPDNAVKNVEENRFEHITPE